MMSRFTNYLFAFLIIFFIKINVSTILFAQNTKIVANQTSLGNWQKVELALNANVPDLIKNGQRTRRQFYPMKSQAGMLDVMWQDTQNKKIIITSLDKSLQNPQTVTLKTSPNEILFGATNDEKDNFYFITHQTFQDDKNDIVILYKTDKKGNIIIKKNQKTDKQNLNIWKAGNYAGDLKCKNGNLYLVMARTMNKSNDGLNHQGGIAVLYDANTLEVTRNFGQTSGHSFDNYATLGEDGLVLIDLGDNYPRGIHLHTLKGKDRKSRIVYTFKTQHGQNSEGYSGTANKFAKYNEISTPTKSFYKWSNDNGVYTELGGVVEVNDGYMVIFAGEPDANGKSINNARISDNYEQKDARNLGIVKVKKDFGEISPKNWNEVPKEMVLTKGVSEKGGFYDFGGSWNVQGNEGVIWLTNLKTPKTANVRNIKTQRLPNGNILILYAIQKTLYEWETEKPSVQMMCIDTNGKVIIPQTTLSGEMGLNRRDEIIMLNNQIISIHGNSETKKMVLHILDLK